MRFRLPIQEWLYSQFGTRLTSTPEVARHESDGQTIIIRSSPRYVRSDGWGRYRTVIIPVDEETDVCVQSQKTALGVARF